MRRRKVSGAGQVNMCLEGGQDQKEEEVLFHIVGSVQSIKDRQAQEEAGGFLGCGGGDELERRQRRRFGLGGVVEEEMLNHIFKIWLGQGGEGGDIQPFK